MSDKRSSYTIDFTAVDKKNIKDYARFFDNGLQVVNNFFQSKLKPGFHIVVHPNRPSLDSTWQKDWNMPNFKSECWMVASGVGSKLDLISPKVWDKESCEHSYSDTRKTQQLITHELVHVFHGQLNVSSDFSNVESIDWMVEGLAVYASGQFDSIRMKDVLSMVVENKVPESLDDFWKGKSKYGLSGSMVMYIDKKFGRESLKQLLRYNKKTDILVALQKTEKELLGEWKNYMLQLAR